MTLLFFFIVGMVGGAIGSAIVLGGLERKKHRIGAVTINRVGIGTTGDLSSSMTPSEQYVHSSSRDSFLLAMEMIRSSPINSSNMFVEADKQLKESAKKETRISRYDIARGIA